MTYFRIPNLSCNRQPSTDVSESSSERVKGAKHQAVDRLRSLLSSLKGSFGCFRPKVNSVEMQNTQSLKNAADLWSSSVNPLASLMPIDGFDAACLPEPVSPRILGDHHHPQFLLDKVNGQSHCLDTIREGSPLKEADSFIPDNECNTDFSDFQASEALSSSFSSTINSLQPTMGDRVVLSGHGCFHPLNGYFRVPLGSTVTVYAKHHGEITNDLGNLIESDRPFDGYQHVFTPGESMRNYQLLPGVGLSLKYNPVTVEVPTMLDNLVKEHPGDIHFAACLIDVTRLEAEPVLRYGVHGPDVCQDDSVWSADTMDIHDFAVTHSLLQTNPVFQRDSVIVN